MIFNLIKRAKELFFDNSKSGLEATDVQGAIDEVNNNLGDTNKNLSNMLKMFFSQAIWLFDGFDYNTLTTTGVYRLSGHGPNNCTNAPSEQCTNCYVIVHEVHGASCFQIILPGNNQYIWYRSLITGTTEWRAWKQAT